MNQASGMDALRRHTAFKGVDEALVERLFKDTEGLVLEPGEVLFAPGQDAEQLYIVMEGHVEERVSADGVLLWVAERGDMIGEVALLANDPKTGGQAIRRSHVACGADEGATVRVLTQAQMEALMASDPAFALKVAQNLATDALRLFQEQHDAERVQEMYFDGRTARLVPAPYECEDVQLTFFAGRASPEQVAAYLPAGVETLPGLADVFLVAFTDFARISQPHRPDAPVFGYRETAFFIPARVGTQVLLYSPAVYPDSFMAVVLGRELFGYRKRPGRTTLNDGRMTLHLDGRRAVQAEFGPTWTEKLHVGGVARALQAFFLGLGFGKAIGRIDREMPVATLKQIPGPEHTDERPIYEVNELVLSPFHIQEITEASVLTGATLKVHGAHVPFEGGAEACRFAMQTRMNFTLKTGRTLRRYDRHDPVYRG